MQRGRAPGAGFGHRCSDVSLTFPACVLPQPGKQWPMPEDPREQDQPAAVNCPQIWPPPRAIEETWKDPQAALSGLMRAFSKSFGESDIGAAAEQAGLPAGRDPEERLPQRLCGL